MSVTGNRLDFFRNRIRLIDTLREFVKRHVFDIVITAVLLVTAGWLVSFGLQVFGGYSQMVEAPTHIIRLQIINGSGDRAAIAAVTHCLHELTDTDLGIEIVARESFAVKDAGRTMVVSREKDLTAANLLAMRLGLDPGTVFFKALEHNRELISATLILGRDFRDVVLTALPEKEKPGKS